MTYRERRERKAERLREWAEKREQKAEQAFGTSDRLASVIPFGQPVLVGHYSQGRDERYRDRISRQMHAGVEHSRTAERMQSRAANIESAVDRAIYSDDVDAVEKLRVKLAGLEAERAAVKAYNAAVKKGTADPSTLTPTLRRDLERSKAVRFDRGGMFPAYVTTNLGGNISRTRKRLAQLEGKS